MLFKKFEEIYQENDFKIFKVSIKNLAKEYVIENYYRNRKPDSVRIAFLENLFQLNNVKIVPQLVSGWYKDDKLFIYDGIHRISAVENC